MAGWTDRGGAGERQAIGQIRRPPAGRQRATAIDDGLCRVHVQAVVEGAPQPVPRVATMLSPAGDQAEVAGRYSTGATTATQAVSHRRVARPGAAEVGLLARWTPPLRNVLVWLDGNGQHAQVGGGDQQWRLGLTLQRGQFVSVRRRPAIPPLPGRIQDVTSPRWWYLWRAFAFTRRGRGNGRAVGLPPPAFHQRE